MGKKNEQTKDGQLECEGPEARARASNGHLKC